jgi:hypothetical protein
LKGLQTQLEMEDITQLEALLAALLNHLAGTSPAMLFLRFLLLLPP